MAELERDLLLLGAELDYPPTPELARPVRARVAALAPRRRTRRALVVVLAALAVGVGTAFAVPGARSTILRWLGLRGVRIELVDRLPEVPVTRSLGLGRRVTLDEAERRAGHPLVTLPQVGRPDGVYIREPGGFVSFVYGSPQAFRLLFSQFAGRAEPDFVKKIAGAGSRVDFVSVAGEPAFWISGGPHFFVYTDASGNAREEPRLAGNTLLWQRGGLTLRLEGRLDEARALSLARGARELSGR